MRTKKTTIQFARDAGVEADAVDSRGRDVPARYVVTCEKHSAFAGSATLRDARVLAAYPNNFCDGCRGKPNPHRAHPTVRPISQEEFLAEFENLWSIARSRRPVPHPTVFFSDHMDRRHARCARSFAEVDTGKAEFYFARAVLSLPPANRLGILAHELGHFLAPRASELGADRAARKWLGVVVTYDPRWETAPDGRQGLQSGRFVNG